MLMLLHYQGFVLRVWLADQTKHKLLHVDSKTPFIHQALLAADVQVPHAYLHKDAGNNAHLEARSYPYLLRKTKLFYFGRTVLLRLTCNANKRRQL